MRRKTLREFLQHCSRWQSNRGWYRPLKRALSPQTPTTAPGANCVRLLASSQRAHASLVLAATGQEDVGCGLPLRLRAGPGARLARCWLITRCSGCGEEWRRAESTAQRTRWAANVVSCGNASSCGSGESGARGDGNVHCASFYTFPAGQCRHFVI